MKKSVTSLLLFFTTLTMTFLLLADIDASTSYLTSTFKSYTYNGNTVNDFTQINVGGSFTVKGALETIQGKITTDAQAENLENFTLTEIKGSIISLSSGAKEEDPVVISFTGDKDDFELTIDLTAGKLFKTVPTTDTVVRVYLEFNPDAEVPAFGELTFYYEVQ